MISEAFLPIRKILKSSFIKDVGILTSGSVVAQLIGIAAVPILSRYYTPHQFGIFGSVSSIFSVLTVIAALRYHLAIVLPDNDSEALNLFALSTICVFLMASLAAAIFWVFKMEIASAFNIREAASYLFFVPVIVLFSGMLLPITYWLGYRKKYGQISLIRVIRAAAKAIFQIFAGIIQIGPVGLLFGSAAGAVSACIYFFLGFIKNEFETVRKKVSRENLFNVAKKHANFPKYSAPQGLVNSLSGNIPVIILVYYFGPEAAGLFFVTIRLLKHPMEFVRKSINMVVFKRMSEAYNKNGYIYPTIMKTTASLMGMALLPSLLILFWGPLFFEVVLGEEWLTAGKLARYLIFWFFTTFINSPAVMAYNVCRKQRFFMYYEMAAFFLKTIALLAGGIYFDSNTTIILFVVTNVACNTFIIGFMLLYSRNQGPSAPATN